MDSQGNILLLTQIRKYKEDDFSESNAVAFSQDVCVHKIHFRHEAHTCNPLRISPPHPSITHPSSVRLGELQAGNSSDTGSLLTPSC